MEPCNVGGASVVCVCAGGYGRCKHQLKVRCLYRDVNYVFSLCGEIF